MHIQNVYTIWRKFALICFDLFPTKDALTVPTAEQILIPCFTFTQLNTFTLGSCPVLPQSSTVGHRAALVEQSVVHFFGQGHIDSGCQGRAGVFVWAFVLHQFIYNISSISVRPMRVKMNELMHSSIQCRENITKLIVSLLAEFRSQTKSASLICTLSKKRELNPHTMLIGFKTVS